MKEKLGESSADNSSSTHDFTVVMQDGKTLAVSEGEFRSLDGKLLFVRRGEHIEIRCPRSKELYTLKWERQPAAHSDGARESASTPTAP